MIFWWKMLILIQEVIACRTQVYGKGGQKEGVIHANPP